MIIGVLTGSLIIARDKQLGSLDHGGIMHARMSIWQLTRIRSPCRHYVTRRVLCQIYGMFRLCSRPLVYNRRLRNRPYWTGRCIILRRDGCRCRCRVVGWLETRLDHRARLRFWRNEAILVRDACMALQQIASSKSRPTEANERFLLSIWAGSAFSIPYGRMTPTVLTGAHMALQMLCTSKTPTAMDTDPGLCAAARCLG